MSTKAVRWTREQIDAYVAKRLPTPEIARHVRERKTAAPIVPGTRLYPLVLLCEAYGLPLPQPEYNFSPTRGFRFDYAFIAQKIACEIEGGIWRKGGGAHSHPLGIVRDIEKYNLAARLGWRVLRAQPEKLAELIEPLREMLT